MKKIYSQPAAEVLSEHLETALLDASIDGNLESYGEMQDFSW